MPAIGPVTPDDLAAAIFIEELRDATGMPIAELARRANLRRERVHSYLSGKTAMSLGTVNLLASLLGASRQDVADGVTAVVARENAAE